MIVLDAAALVDVVIDDVAAPWVLDQLKGTDTCVPCHQPAEVLAAIARLQLAGVLDRRTAAEALDEALAIRQELVAPTLDHVNRALELNDRIRALDGLYVALAEERTCALVTTDRRLARAGVGDVRSPPRGRR